MELPSAVLFLPVLATLWPCPLLAQCPASSDTLCISDNPRADTPHLGVSFKDLEVFCNQRLPTSLVQSPPQITIPRGVSSPTYLLLIIDPDHPTPCGPGITLGGGRLLYMAIMKNSSVPYLTARDTIVPYEVPTSLQGQHRIHMLVFLRGKEAPAPKTPNRDDFHVVQLKTPETAFAAAAVFQFRVSDSPPSAGPVSCPEAD